MSPISILLITTAYFLLLFVISFITGRDSSDDAFFLGNRKSPWYLVAFGMIGASLSGITFISVPGAVGASKFGYLQMVLGYLLGYLVIATVLMPIYYRLNLTSIYTYLDKRLGKSSYKTGAGFFLLSRTIGAALRLYLVASVLQYAMFSAWGVPFWLTVMITIALIWLYTYRGGIKTIVYTDTLQTLFMILSLLFTIIYIGNHFDLQLVDLFSKVQVSEYSKTFFWEINPGNNFFKQFFSGAFIAVVMTGMDQDMMQKNLSCRSLGDAQKNMFWFSIILLIVNFLFLVLGALLFMYIQDIGVEVPVRIVNGVEKTATDLLFPRVALEHTNFFLGAMFFIGLLAAAYSSADSALTALTTSFCIDFLNYDENRNNPSTRRIVHLAFSFLLFLVVLLYNALANDALIWDIFRVAMYTYGPILGLFVFGIFTKRKIKDNLSWTVLIICIASVLLSLLLNYYTNNSKGNFSFGFLILPINGLITFSGLWLISKKGTAPLETAN